MSTILLTGVTGQVGSQLAPLLQKQGHTVLYLVRAGNHRQAVNRLHKVLPRVQENDIALAGDVTQPLGGIKPSQVRKWRGAVDKIVHCAASIKFDREAADEIWQTNVEGTRQMLNLTEALAGPEFHYLGTAYIAGDAVIFSEDDRDVGQTSRNPYEKSKLEAEKLITRSRFSHTILRMSIVIGDSGTGFTPAFNGYFGFFKGFWRLKKYLHEQWVTDKERLKRMGVQFDEQGNLELPLSIDCSPNSTLNLITSDWLSDMLAKLVDAPANDQVFHLVHPNPPRVQWVIETSLELMGIKGIRFREPNISADYPMLRTLQGGVRKNVARFLPYITHEPVFECRNLNGYHSPPPVNRELLSQMLKFAMSVDFESDKIN